MHSPSHLRATWLWANMTPVIQGEGKCFRNPVQSSSIQARPEMTLPMLRNIDCGFCLRALRERRRVYRDERLTAPVTTCTNVRRALSPGWQVSQGISPLSYAMFESKQWWLPARGARETAFGRWGVFKGPPRFPAQQDSSLHRAGNFAKSIYNPQKHSLKNAAFVSRKTLVNVSDLESTLQWHIKDRACKKQLICNPRKSPEENVGWQLWRHPTSGFLIGLMLKSSSINDIYHNSTIWKHQGHFPNSMLLSRSVNMTECLETA